MDIQKYICTTYNDRYLIMLDTGLVIISIYDMKMKLHIDKIDQYNIGTLYNRIISGYDMFRYFMHCYTDHEFTVYTNLNNYIKYSGVYVTNNSVIRLNYKKDNYIKIIYRKSIYKGIHILNVDDEQYCITDTDDKIKVVWNGHEIDGTKSLEDTIRSWITSIEPVSLDSLHEKLQNLTIDDLSKMSFGDIVKLDNILRSPKQ